MVVSKPMTKPKLTNPKRRSVKVTDSGLQAGAAAIAAETRTRSEMAEKLRTGFADAVRTAVQEHRAAGRTVHEAKVKTPPSR